MADLHKNTLEDPGSITRIQRGQERNKRQTWKPRDGDRISSQGAKHTPSPTLFQTITFVYSSQRSGSPGAVEQTGVANALPHSSWAHLSSPTAAEDSFQHEDSSLLPAPLKICPHGRWLHCKQVRPRKMRDLASPPCLPRTALNQRKGRSKASMTSTNMVFRGSAEGPQGNWAFGAHRVTDSLTCPIRSSLFPVPSLPTSSLVLPDINSPISHLHSNPCLRICFRRDRY